MLRFCDSFSHYTLNELLGTGNGSKWTTFTGISAANSAIKPNGGRIGGNCLQVSSSGSAYITKTLDNQATWIIGFAFKLDPPFPTSSGITLVALYDAGTLQCDVRIMLDQTLQITRNGTALTGGKSTVALQGGVWYYIEWKCTINASISANTCKVNLNNVNIINVTTGQSTKNSANSTANQIALGINGPNSNGTYNYCDFYACDSQGSINNDFLGDIRVEYRAPLAASATNHDWTANGATSIICVNDQTPNGDINFISSSTTNQISTFTLPTLASTPVTIYGMQMLHNSRKTDAGNRSIADLLRSGSTNYSGTTQALSSSYAYYPTIYENNPNTSTPWTETTANAVEIGVKEIT